MSNIWRMASNKWLNEIYAKSEGTIKEAARELDRRAKKKKK